MNIIEVCTMNLPENPVLEEAVKKFSNEVLLVLQKLNWELSIMLCDDSYIKELNRMFRDKNFPTDVLSFEQGEFIIHGKEKYFLAGDIVISLDTLNKNAIEFHVNENEELKRLLIHGILHLSGLDHTDNSPGQEMLVYQEKLLTQFPMVKLI